MRKIHTDMIAAINAGKSKSTGNTTVSCQSDDPFYPVMIFLHGNWIARRDPAGNWSFTLAGWPTPTTRARINALLAEFKPGAGVYQSKGAQWYQAPSGFKGPISDRAWVEA